MAGVLLSLLLLLIGYYLHLSCSNTSVNRSNDEDNTTKSDDTLQGIPLNETLSDCQNPQFRTTDIK